MQNILSTLNPQQLEAVTTTEGPVLILAGAGSGKTKVITVRTAYLMAHCNVQGKNILAVTFTNKAAEEMRERICTILGMPSAASSKLSSFSMFSENPRLAYSLPVVCTFHSLCAQILRQDIENLEEGYTRNFNIYDSDESEQIIKNCIKSLGIDEKRLTPKFVQALISGAKNRGENLEVYIRDYPSAKRNAILNVAASYQREMKNANALDFDDLLLKTVQLLQRDEKIRLKYNSTFKYIMVDEYQDTNPLQFALLQLLTELHQNICVVGDDAQSIYGFRHADIRNILDFEKHYPSAKIIKLEQNYRSTKTILNVAEAVIRNNLYRKDKKLWTNNPEGEKVYHYQAATGEEEAEFVVSKIEEILKLNPQERVAVLYRTNAQSRLFEEALRRRGIKYKIVGGFSFYQRAEIKDIVAYLKVILNPSDNLALERIINVPQREIGDVTIEKVREFARLTNVSLWEAISVLVKDTESSESSEFPESTTTIKPKLPKRSILSLRQFKALIENLRHEAMLIEKAEKSISEFIKEVIEKSGYLQMLMSSEDDRDHNRAENLAEFVSAATRYDEKEDGSPNGLSGLRAFIDYASLTSSADDFDKDSNLTLMTIHAAKGLEFPIVFLVGLEQGVFPHVRSLDDENQLEEERRLCYVALTRAQKVLFLTHAKKRRFYLSEVENEPSTFLKEIPRDSLKDLSYFPSWLALRKERQKKESSKLEAKHSDISTYNSVEAVDEFFKRRSSGLSTKSETLEDSEIDKTIQNPSQIQNSPRIQDTSQTHGEADEVYPGMYVRHEKYGRGLVLRKEGKGENAKLTITFPGFGVKKLVEKYAKLKRD